MAALFWPSDDDDGADVEHAEGGTTGRTRRPTRHPRLWLCLILATGKPLAHAFKAPHRTTETLDAWTIGQVATQLLQLHVR